MANQEITLLRLLLAEPNQPTGTPPPSGQSSIGSLFSDDQLEALIGHTSTLNRAAEIGWNAKAAYLQPLVDVEESGTSRKLSQMYKQALSLAERYKVTADEEVMALSAAVRTVGEAAAPWGRQYKWVNASSFSTYLIGDVSRAGAGGSIIFIEVPVDPDALQDKTTTAPPVSEPIAVLETTRIQVPTVRRQPLNVEKGRTFKFWFDYIDPYTGDQVDITGWTAEMAVVVNGVTVFTVALTTDISGHSFDLVISATATAAFSWAAGDYEVVSTAVDGTVTTLARGLLTVSAGDL